MQSLDRALAKLVFAKVQQYEKADPKQKDLYGGMAQKMPVLIHASGLAQALAFVNAKGTDERPIFLRLLGDLAAVLDFGDKDQLLKASREAHLPQYAFLTRRSLLALEWFARFSQSVLNVPRGAEEVP